MKLFQKIISVALAFTILTGLGTGLPQEIFPMRAAAADASDTGIYGDFTYRLINEYTQVEITKYNGSGGAVEIPENIEGKIVSSIGNSAFRNCSELQSVAIPGNVKTIDSSAFYFCTALTDLSLAEGIETIGSEAFSRCVALKSLTIPDSVKTIGDSAFYDCSALESVNLGKGVSGIDGTVFSSCTALEEITVNAENTAVCSLDSALFNKAQTTLIAYLNAKTSAYTIPNTVTVIGNSAFSNCSELQSVVIPGNVKTIDSSAFSYCTALTDLSLEEGIETIGAQAFSQCSALKSLTIPDSVKTIDNFAFSSCSALESVSLGKGVITIGSYAFSGCLKITEITIPDSVSTVDSSAFSFCTGLKKAIIGKSVSGIDVWLFSSCTALEEITVNAENTAFSSLNGVLFNKAQTTLITYPDAKTGAYTIPDTVTVIGNSAFQNCNGLTGITIGKGVTSIDKSAFSYCTALESVNLGKGVTSIGNSAFSNCSKLQSAVIPGNVKTIGNSAFYYCTALTDLSLEEGIETIGSDAFYRCSALKSLTIPDSVKTIDKSAFSYCTALESVNLGKGVTSIGNSAFSNCSALEKVDLGNGIVTIDYGAFKSCPKLAEIVIPDSVETIGDFAFQNCNGLTGITIGKGVTSIGNDAFRDCSKLQSAVIPGNVKTIGLNAFYNCTALMDLSLGEGIETIGSDAFYRCSALKSLTIPDSVKTIDNAAFYSCTALESVNLGKGITSIGSNAFNNCSALEKVDLGNGIVTINYGAFNFCPKLAEIVIPDSVKTIGDSAFQNCNGLTGITIGKGVTSIGNDTFGNCSKLQSTVIPGNVKTIGSNAFYNCTALTDLSLGEGIETIGSEAFSQCYALKSLTIPDSVKTIDKSAFFSCTALESVNLGKGVTSIGNSAFSNCSALEKVDLGNGIVTIDYGAFESCPKLAEIVIPDSVETIGNSAFQNCNGLTGITIGKGVTSIGNDTFGNCSKLQSAVIPGNVKTIGSNAFSYCTALTDLSLEEGIETIGSYAFYYCSSLKSLIIPGSVKTIGEQSFYQCTALENVNLGKGVVTIGFSAFSNCLKMTEITIPNSVETIENYAFQSCSGIQQVTLGNGLKTIGTNVFYYCPISTVYCYENSYGHTYAKTLANTEIRFIKKDFPVTGLTTSALSSGSVTLKWNKPNGYDNISEYIIYRDTQEIGRTSNLTYTESGLTEGQEYSYEVVAVNTDGNISPKVKISVVPNCPGIQSISMPGGAIKIGGTQPVRITAAMESALAFSGSSGKFYYSVDRENWTLIGDARPLGSEQEYIADWDLTELSSGTYIVKFVFTDKDGANKEKTMSVEVDRTPPEQIFGFAVFADVTNIKLSWGIAAEIDTGIYRIYRKADDEVNYRLITEIRNRNTLNYIDKNVSQDAVYEYYIVGVDEFNQESTPTEPIRISLNQDVDAPRITGLSPASGSIVGGSRLFSVTATDNVAVTKIELYYSLDNSKWVLLDSADGTSYSKYVDTSKIPDGTVYYKALAYDRAGNTSDGTPVYTIKVDNTGPEKVTGTACSSVTATTATLSWQDVADNDLNYFVVEMKNLTTGQFAEYSRTSTKLGMNLSGLKPDRQYTFRVAAYDKTGNRGTVSDEIIFTTLPDTTVPIITNILPAPNYFSSQIPMDIRVWDDSAVASVTAQVSKDLTVWKDVYTYTLPTPQKTPSVTYKLDLTNYQEGVLYVRAVATDVAGNQSASGSTAPYSQYIVDKTAPNAPSTLQALPQNGTIELRWTQENEDCFAYALYRSTSADGEFTLLADNIKALNYFDRAIEANTAYYYQLKAKDYAGNISEFSSVVSGQMEKDTQAPEILSINPAASTIGVGYRTVSVLAQDNNRLASISIQYKTTGDYITLVTKENINASSQIVIGQLPLDDMQDGTQVTVRAVATDLFGNQSSEENAIVIYTVDKTAPQVSELKAVSSKDSITLTWIGAEETDLAGYRIYRKTAGSNTETLVGQRAVNGKTYTFTDSQVLSLMSYYYRVEAVDNVGNTASIESEKVNSGSQGIIGAGAPEARLKVQSVMEVGVDYLFDASSSTDETGIASCHIDFGDGSGSDEAKAVHRYKKTGSYSVTLTVTDDDGNSTTLKMDVIVTVREAIGQVKVTVANSNGALLPNMPVYFDLGGSGQAVAYTGSNGSVTFETVIGKFTIGTYEDGYLPVKQEVVVGNGNITEVKLVVVQQPIVTGEFEIHRMTLSEIITAGIDVSAPENQNVVKITGYLYYGPESIPFIFNANDKGVIDSKPIIKDFGDGTGKHSLTPTYLGGSKKPIIAIVDIPMEASFLKDFFDVKLHIMNHASAEYSLLNNMITLNVPSGLTVMDAKGHSSTAAVYVDEIKGQETYTASWVLRGDVPGEYEISADYFGVVSQFNAPVQAKFIAKDPIQVRGGSGLEMYLDASKTLFQGNAYFDFGLHNNGREATYMPDIDVEGAVLREIQFEDASGNRETITEIPQTLNPGETLWKRYYKQTKGNVSLDLDFKNTLGQIAKKFGMSLFLNSYPITYFIDFSEMYPDSDADINLEPGTYCIKVIDETTGLSISGASVVTDKDKGATDEKGMIILNLPEDNTLKELTVSKEDYDTLKIQQLMLPRDRIKVVYLKGNIPDIQFENIPKDHDKLEGPYIDFLGKKIPILSLDVSLDLPGYGEIVKFENDKEEKKLRYAFGLNPSVEIEKDTDVYEDLLSVVKAYGGGHNTINVLNKFNRLKQSLQSFEAPIGVNASGYFMGYAEFSYASGRVELVEGGLLIGFSAGVSYSYPLAPLPVYVKLSLTGDIDGNFHWTITDTNMVNYGGSLGLTITPSLAAGVGADKIASFEAGLNANINGELTFPFQSMKQSFEASLAGEFYIQGKFLIFVARKAFDLGTLQLYPEFGTKSSRALWSLDEDDLQLMPRDYLKNRSSNQARTVGGQKASYSKENVFPYGDPQLLDIGNGKQLLVWVDDNPQRSDANRTQLYYTVYNGTAWSQAQPVCKDDGTADFAPRLSRDGDKVYLVWQNLKKALTDSVTTEEMAQASDLSLAVFDGTSFSEPTALNLPDNTRYEIMHSVAVKDGNVSVVWLENSENDPFLLTGRNSIFRRVCVSGEWQAQECLKNDLPLVTGLDVDYAGEDCLIAYSVDMDSDVSTNGDTEVFMFQNAQEKRITNDTADDIGLQFLNGVLYWNAGGIWKMIKDNTVSELGLEAPADAVILENNREKAAIWTQTEGYKNELVVTYQNSSAGTWTAPVPLTNESGNFRAVSAFLKEDGEIAYACNWAEVLGNTKENELPYGRTDLVVMQKNENCNLTLDSGVIYDDSKMLPGETLPLTIAVCNNSRQPVDHVDVSVTNVSGAEVLRKTVECNLAAGETKDITIDFTVPSPLVKEELTITVLPSGLQDSDCSDNIAKLSVGEADLVLSETSLIRNGDKVTVNGTVTNTGYDTAKNIKAVIYQGGIYGEKIAEVPLTDIAPEGNVQIAYELPADKIAFTNENERKIFFVEVKTETEESDYANNSADMVLEPVLANEVSIDKDSVNLKLGGQVKITAKAMPENAVNQELTWICSNTNVAIVDQTGQIKAVGYGTATVTALTSNGKAKQIAVNVGSRDFTMVMKYDSQYSVLNGEKITNTPYSNGYASMTLAPEGISMVPVRFLCETTGLQVFWDEELRRATITNTDSGEYLRVTPGNRNVIKYAADGKILAEFNLPIEPQIINGITMVPLRAVSECLGYFVEYVEKDYGTYVIVSSTPQMENIEAICETAKKLDI